ncbi:MAG: deoxyribose-phosphate aldolase [Mycoplasmoidaceae bacterium]|nr:deoxyribose-phosphate aldolase [Mycoplasmoidaceae bacterium]
MPACKKFLAGSNVKVCTVIGFPLGSMTTEAKVFETKDAIAKGADEIDMVLNISQLKAKNFDYVVDEINKIKAECPNNVLKVIIETCLLSEEDKINACKCVSQSNADFIKTSTGFSTGGATVADVKLLRQHTSSNKKVKAAGGVRTHQDLVDMVNAGAERIGTSRGVDLIK